MHASTRLECAAAFIEILKMRQERPNRGNLRNACHLHEVPADRLESMLRRIVGLSIAVPAARLLWFAAMANDAWFQRHVVLPAYRLPPPAWTLPALRIGAIALGLGLIACAVAAGRRATAGGVARGSIALVLSVCACELVLRLLQRPEAEMPNPRLEWILGVPDARTGWAFVPNRTMDLPRRGRQRLARYAIDAHGDRAPTQDWFVDPTAPTVIVAGESTA